MENEIDKLEKDITSVVNKFGKYHIDLISKYNFLADKYLQIFDNDQAIKFYEKAIEIILKTHGVDHLYTAASYHNIAGVYEKKGNYDRALTYYNMALDIHLKTLGEDHPDTCKSFNNIGGIYSYKGDYDNALAFHVKAHNIRFKIFGEDHPDTATSKYNIASAYYYKGDYNNGIEYNNKALNVFIKIYGENHPDTALSYVNIASGYYSIGDYNRALTYYKKALDVFIKLYGENHPDTALSYNNIAFVYSYKYEYNKALTYYEKALNIRLKTLGENHPDTASSYDNIARTYSYKGDHDRSLIYCKKALDIRLKTLGENHPDTASSYDNIARTYCYKGDYDSSLAYYKITLDIRLKTLCEVHPNIARSYNNIARIYYYMCDYYKAITYSEKALDIQLKTLGNDHPDTATYYSNSGVYFLKIEKFDKAIEYWNISISILNKINYLNLTPFLKLGSYRNSENNFSEAINTFKEGISLLENWLKNNDRSKTLILHQNITIFYHYIDANAKINDLLSIFKATEKMRARGFMERISIKTAASVSGISQEDSRLLLQLTDEIEKLINKRSREIEKPLDSKDVHALIDIANRLEISEKERDDLYVRLLANDRFKELVEPVFATLEEAQVLCGEKTAILEYIIWEGDEKERQSYCLVVTRENVTLSEINWDDECAEAARKCMPDDFEHTFGNLHETASLLYARCIGPIGELLAGMEDLIISPDGPLAFVPFDFLLLPDGGYLCEKYTISMVPSVSVMKMIHDRVHPDDRDDFLGIGDILYNRGGNEGERRSQTLSDRSIEYHASRSGIDGLGGYRKAINLTLDNLPHSGEELRSIANDIFHVPPGNLVLREEASEENIKKLSADGELSKYGIVHFACHGDYDEDIPQNSSLILAEYLDSRVKKDDEAEEVENDGWLDVNDVALLNLKADIVTLSACETGRGIVVRGDGIVGLTRAFMVAGANNVASTLWSIHDEATKDFMIKMYARVKKENQSYREAFRNTKLEFIKSDLYNYPFYWAGFVLWGA